MCLLLTPVLQPSLNHDEFRNLRNLAQIIVILDHDGDDDYLKHISAPRTTILRQRNNTYLRKRTNHINSTPILSNVSYIMCLKFCWLKIILFLTIDLVRWCPLDMALPVSTPGVLVDLLSSVYGYFPIFYAKYIFFISICPKTYEMYLCHLLVWYTTVHQQMILSHCNALVQEEETESEDTNWKQPLMCLLWILGEDHWSLQRYFNQSRSRHGVGWGG